MDFKTYIYKRLRELRNEMTQQEMAKKAGCAQSYINHILNSPPDTLATVRLDILLKLFPELFASVVQNVHADNGIGIANGDYATVNNTQSYDSIQLERSILDDDDICDKCKVKVLKLLKSHK